MEWHPSDAEQLAMIDRQVGHSGLPPAVYEVVRRAIFASGDFDYLTNIYFSDKALASGAAALVARTTIVVDAPTVQVGLVRTLQATFANPVYCGAEAITRPQRSRSELVWGVETLARRYPEGIFAIGQSAIALSSLIELIQAGDASPALIIATPPCFGEQSPHDLLKAVDVPHICTQGSKGGATIVAAILEALMDLSWQAYSRKNTHQTKPKAADTPMSV